MRDSSQIFYKNVPLIEANWYENETKYCDEKVQQQSNDLQGREMMITEMMGSGREREMNNITYLPIVE